MINFELLNQPYIIAEIGANHNGDIELAKELIISAKNCGANCVKFQIKMEPFELATYDHMISLEQGKVKLENVSEWKSEQLGLKNIKEQVEKFHFSREEYLELINFTKEQKIDVSASCFTKEGVDFLSDSNIDFIKIASMDVINYDLIKYVLDKNLPFVISTGMANEEEIFKLNKIIPEFQKPYCAVLHCVSIYPPEIDSLQLSFINTIKRELGITTGYSDHTIGSLYSLIAIGFGAKIIEKHFTLDKNLPGWDHKISADPMELKYICENAKDVENSIGNGTKIVHKSEIEKQKKFRRSLTTIKSIQKGATITKEDITYKRPGTGIPVNHFDQIIGKKLNKNIDADKTINWDDII